MNEDMKDTLKKMELMFLSGCITTPIFFGIGVVVNMMSLTLTIIALSWCFIIFGIAGLFVCTCIDGIIERRKP